MATEWFYFKNEQRIGPFGSQQLKELAVSGALVPTDLIWKEGMASPQPASKLKGLFEAAAVTPVIQSAPSPSSIHAAPPVDASAKLDSFPGMLWGWYKRYVLFLLKFFLSVATATWEAANRFVGDLKDRRATQRLRSELEKQQKTNSTLSSSDPALQTQAQAVQQAQQALESHEERVAVSKEGRLPLDKLRVGIGIAVVVVAFMAAVGGDNKDKRRSDVAAATSELASSDSELSLANGPVPLQTFLAALKEQRGSLEMSTPDDGNDISGTPFELSSLMTLRQFPKPYRFHLGSFDDSLSSKMTVVLLQAGPDKKLVEVMLAKPFDTSSPKDRSNDNNNLIKLIENHLLPGCEYREFFRTNTSKIILGGANLTYEGVEVVTLLKGKELQVHISLQPNNSASSPETRTSASNEPPNSADGFTARLPSAARNQGPLREYKANSVADLLQALSKLAGRPMKGTSSLPYGKGQYGKYFAGISVILPMSSWTTVFGQPQDVREDGKGQRWTVPCSDGQVTFLGTIPPNGQQIYPLYVYWDVALKEFVE